MHQPGDVHELLQSRPAPLCRVRGPGRPGDGRVRVMEVQDMFLICSGLVPNVPYGVVRQAALRCFCLSRK